MKRIRYALAAGILLAVEVVIALFVHDKFIRPYIGDVLVVILLYCVVRIAMPEKLRLLPVCVFLFACFAEWMQYLRIVERLGLQNNVFLRTLMGSVFDLSDILAYLAGCVILTGYEIFRRRKEEKNHENCRIDEGDPGGYPE